MTELSFIITVGHMDAEEGRQLDWYIETRHLAVAVTVMLCGLSPFYKMEVVYWFSE